MSEREDMLAGDQLTVLSHYWVEKYIRWGGQSPPFVALVGRERDAVGSADQFGDTIIENLAFMTGYLAYPADAVYLTAVFPVVGELTSDTPLPSGFDHRAAVVSWSHCIATSESYTLMMARSILDDGTERWEQVEPDDNVAEAELQPLMKAAHDFDLEEIDDLEPRSRANAQAVVERSNGVGYTASWLEAGETLDAAIFAAVNGEGL